MGHPAGFRIKRYEAPFGRADVGSRLAEKDWGRRTLAEFEGPRDRTILQVETPNDPIIRAC